MLADCFYVASKQFRQFTIPLLYAYETREPQTYTIPPSLIIPASDKRAYFKSTS